MLRLLLRLRRVRLRRDEVRAELRLLGVRRALHFAHLCQCLVLGLAQLQRLAAERHELLLECVLGRVPLFVLLALRGALRLPLVQHLDPLALERLELARLAAYLGLEVTVCALFLLDAPVVFGA